MSIMMEARSGSTRGSLGAGQRRFDLAIQDASGNLVATVEIRGRQGTSRDWAAQLRRNLLSHGGFPAAEFFLIATPDRLYLWKGADTEPRLIPPMYEVDAEPIFRPYLVRSGIPLRELREAAFELMVATWLGELVYGFPPPDDTRPPQDWLVESGFLATVREGNLEYPAAA